MVLLSIRGKISCRLRTDVTSSDVAEEIGRSLRGVGLVHTDVTRDEASFARNFGVSQLFLMASRGSFSVRLNGALTSIHYDISMVKSWIVTSIVGLILSLPIVMEHSIDYRSKYDMVVSTFVLMILCNVAYYVMILVQSRMFLRQCLGLYAA